MLWRLFFLYVSQGLPAGLLTQALPVILREQGASLKLIGLIGLVLVPWSFKFMWAPLVDHRYLTSVNRYQLWIIPTQCVLIILVLMLAFYYPILFHPEYWWCLGFVLFVMSLCSATQDIAIDGLAVSELTTQQQRSAGSAVQVSGYRLGIVIGGGGLLWMSATVSLMSAFVIMAFLMAFMAMAALRFQDSVHGKESYQAPLIPFSWRHQRQAVVAWLRYFWDDSVRRYWVVVLLVSRLADGLSSPMVKPLMVDMGLSREQIGLYASVLGSLASILGAGMGMLINRLTNPALAMMMLLGVQIFPLLAYIYYLHVGTLPAYWLFVINCVEHITTAMLLVALFLWMMRYARTQFAATDFTVQVSVMSLGIGTTHLLSGFIADAIGYNWLFWGSIICAVFSIMAALPWFKRSRLA